MPTEIYTFHIIPETLPWGGTSVAQHRCGRLTRDVREATLDRVQDPTGASQVDAAAEAKSW